MNYLLDTHAVVWFFEDSMRMPNHIKEIIKDPNNNIYVSSITLLEIIIKSTKHPDTYPMQIDELYNKLFLYKFDLIQIELNQLLLYKQLPYIHKDPYDRMLIATAITNDLLLITEDNKIHEYDVKWIW